MMRCLLDALPVSCSGKLVCKATDASFNPQMLEIGEKKSTSGLKMWGVCMSAYHSVNSMQSVSACASFSRFSWHATCQNQRHQCHFSFRFSVSHCVGPLVGSTSDLQFPKQCIDVYIPILFQENGQQHFAERVSGRCAVRVSVLFFSSHLVSAFDMAVDDAAKRAYLADHVSSDLQYIWQESDVSLGTQYELAQHYKTMKVFSSMCDTKADVRAALRTDFRIDAATGPEVRADVAKVLTAWELSRNMTTKEQELQAETKVLGMPRVLQHTERSSNGQSR